MILTPEQPISLGLRYGGVQADQRTLGCCERAIPVSDVLELLRRWIQDLDIGCQVVFAIGLCELAECLICDGRDVKFMIANGQDIIVNVLEDRVGDVSVDTGGVRNAISVV